MSKKKTVTVLKIFLIALLLLCLIVSMIAPAFASTREGSSIEQDTIDDEGSSIEQDTIDDSGSVLKRIIDYAMWGNTWNDILGLAQIVSISLAVVAIAVGGLMMASSVLSGSINDKDQSTAFQRGKAIVKYAIMALFAIFLLPIVFREAASLFTSGSLQPWSPPSSSSAP